MHDLECLWAAGPGGRGGGSDPNAVKFTPQTLTAEQQAQARTNIGAAESGSGGGGVVYVEATMTDDTHFVAKINGENATYSDVKTLYDAGNLIVVKFIAEDGYFIYFQLTSLETGNENPEKHAFVFTAYSAESNTLEVYIATLKNDGTNVGTIAIVTVGE